MPTDTPTQQERQQAPPIRTQPQSQRECEIDELREHVGHSEAVRLLKEANR